MKVIGIIPARLASTRFPNKPLVKILGRSMIEHVYRRALLAKQINELYIATCDIEIAEAAKAFGGKVIMTSPKHNRGTDRVAEAAKKIDANMIFNIQGDEPIVDPEALDGAILAMKNNAEAKCINLIAPISDKKFFLDYNVVKAVIDRNNRIIYFSRKPIPTSINNDPKEAFKQIGIYLFRKDFLLQFSSWNETPLEKQEKVDMLRIIEHGYPIHTFITRDTISVDNPEDAELARQALLKDKLYHRIFKSNVYGV